MDTENNNGSQHPKGAEHHKVWEVNDSSAKCPFMGGENHQVAGGGTSNRDWWPNAVEIEHSSPTCTAVKPDARRV